MQTDTVARPTGPDISRDSRKAQKKRSKLIRSNRTSASIALVFLCLLVLIAIFAPLVATHDYAKQDYSHILAGPSSSHFLGTDDFGRDVFSRLVYGARLSLGSSVIAVSVGLIIGLPIGLASGYIGRWFDVVAMRVVDTFMAFPSIILAIAVTAILGTGVVTAMIAVGVVLIPSFARLIRGQVLSVRSRLYVDAARTFGGRSWWIIMRHIFPNSVQPVVILAAHLLGVAILIEASLSFLGLGAPPPQPGWGAMLREAARSADGLTVQVIAPGAAIALTLLALNLLGDRIRDMFDPRIGRNQSRRSRRRAAARRAEPTSEQIA
ncbi:peptide/nickel transport system permease protein [Antricoccus suffuscus]|uniref:Peptide/nickel transport system permease protein n=1 Tax=Antricoccus suffuscus TaxID=1629062 RepID=A0A2T0ZTP1_9ACTN|nr:ABC transporter permease [Antricoccus suffuscus]PRZ39721.1 peptide/nickel transport system permease protein [Antricoccus suffuscus]